MTTQEALMEIAEAFLTPFNDRSGRQVELSKYGICHAFRVLELHNCVTAIMRFVGDYNYFTVSFTHTRDIGPSNFRNKYDIYRGMFCLLLATMPEDDFKEIWREA